MAYCHACGSQLATGAGFCDRCGTHVNKGLIEEFSVNADELVKKVKEIIHEGNVTKIIVKDEQGKVLIEVPVTAGLIGAVLAPWLAGLGAIAALVTRCTITVERKE